MKPIREIRLTNTKSGKKEILETLTPGKLTMYSCGPTVYGYIHIGNLRAALVSDLFFRYFKRVGYDVHYVRNYTDVDDKIIDRAKEEGTTPESIAKKYIQEVEKDYAVAGLLSPTHKTTVTTHMAEIIAMIEQLLAHGNAYVVDGEVLYSIQSFGGYGKLSGKNIDDLIAGSRVAVDEKKRNPLDFSLWKPAKPGEPAWDSPWAKGRPGWHIECSAMASKWLGDRIDVHHGGQDLVFPHHENEIAQSEAASHQSPFVRYWLHNAFLTFSKEKMSKSLGNVVSARDFLTQFGGEFTRYTLLSVHYRSPIDFSEDTLEQARSGLLRIYEAKARAQELTRTRAAVPDQRAESAWGQFMAEVEHVRQEMDAQLANDFNTAGALAELFKLIRDFNRTLAEPLAQATPSAVLGAQALLQTIEEDLGGVIGVGRLESSRALKELEEIKLKISGREANAVRLSEEEIQQQIKARALARESKNFAEADRIRKDLETKGVVLKDSPQGATSWSYK